jgi:hypothetical protein
VLVAADYRMKQIGMGHEKSAILPSYLQMVTPSGNGMQSMTPRWWMVPDYKAITKDPDGLAWGLEGSSVKTMTEETLFNADGSKKQTGKASPAAQKWADMMTSKFDELARKDSIFGQLRNCMDLAVLSALIVKQDLSGKAGYQLPLWLDDASLPAVEMIAPRTTDTQVSFAKRGSNWIITASGGVQLGLEQLVARTQQSDKVEPVRQQARPAADAQPWWWD